MRIDGWFSKRKGERDERVGADVGPGSEIALDSELQSALRNFRRSVHAWSDATDRRPRQVEIPPRRRFLRVAAAWIVGSLLIAGGAGGGFLENQHRQERARLAAAHEAERQLQFQEERARQAEQELAQVDRDVSREVPDALEPLARLMTVDGSQEERF